MVKTHELKIRTKYFPFVVSGAKSAEIRFNVRNYEVGDTLILHEWTGTHYTGEYVVRVVTYVLPLNDFGFKKWVLICMK